jgi:hypothetical protein
MTESIYTSDHGLLNKILSHHSDEYRITSYPTGRFDIDLKGHFGMSAVNIKRIEKEYDCHLENIFNPNHGSGCGCEDCNDDGSYTVLRFAENHPKFRPVKLKCGHTQEFAQTYPIENKSGELCDECDAWSAVDANDIKTIDEKYLEANK